METWWVYIVLLFSSVINIVVPISGSSTVTPLLALLTDPHRAIGLASFYFVLSGLVRIYLFRKNIQWHEIKILLIPSVLMAFVGGFALVAIPTMGLLVIIFVSTLYFLFKKLQDQKTRKSSKITGGLVGVFSGFLQGTGLAGSDLRNSYLYSQGLDIAEVHGTTALIGTSNFFIATVARLISGQLTVPDLTPLVYLFPLIILAILIGRHILYRLPKKATDVIVVITMSAIVILLGLKIVSLL